MIGHESARSGEVPRDGLLARVRAARPALLVLAAPAGFGKSTFAHQAFADAENVGIADCALAQQVVDLGRAVLAGLADAFPGNRQEFGRPASVLSDASISLEERLSTLLAVWREPRPASTIVFENTEHAIRGEARDLLARLLAERPSDRRIVMCSREPLRLHLSRFAAPHQILTLRAADLAFSDAEVRRAFGTRALSPEQLERVARVSRGWPIAVLLFVRFADEGRVDALLEELDAIAYDELHEYVVDQVLDAMPPAMRDALLFCSAVTDAGAGDIEAAFGAEAAVAFERFARESPFVQRRLGVYEVHPLAAGALRDAVADRLQSIVRPAAANYVDRGDARNAARMFFVLGDAHAAAAQLNRIDVSDLDVDLARMKTALPNEVRRLFPNVWGNAALLRLYQTPVDEMRIEGEAVWNACTEDTPVGTRLNIGYIRVLHEQYVGRFAEAIALLDELQPTIDAWNAGGDPAEEQRRLVALACLHFFRGLVLARCGSIRGAEEELYAVNRTVAPSLIVSGMHFIAGADIARARGERDIERREIEKARELASAAGYLNYVALYTAEAAIGAWLAGEDELTDRCAAELEELVERDGVFAFGFFAAMLRGREREPRAADLMKYVCFGQLVAAANAPDRATRTRALAQAMEIAERFGSPYTLVLTALALAFAGPAQERSERIARARDALRAVDDGAALVGVVDDVAAGGSGGFLAPFLRRYRSEERPKDDLAAVRICFAGGRVFRHGVEVKLGHTVEAVLFALAESPRGVAVSSLCDRFWDDVDADGSRNALKVTLWRLRKVLGDITIRAEGNVRLTNVTVDVWEAEALYRSARDAGDVARREALLREAFALLDGPRPGTFDDWEWFEPIARRIDERRAEIAALLARTALERGEAEDAHRLGESIAAYDPLDEVGQEIVVRALLARGERSEALRRFRRYRDALRAELDCDPSPAFARLLQHEAAAQAVRAERGDVAGRHRARSRIP